MKRLVLLLAGLVPTAVFTVANPARASDGPPRDSVERPEASAPWFRPSGSDAASLQFRHGDPGLKEGPTLVLARKPADLAPPPSEHPGLRMIEGELSATPERAEQSVRSRLNQAVADWIAEAGVPRSWKTPTHLLDSLILETRVEEIAKDYGTVYQAKLRVDLSPENRARLVDAWNHEIVARRLAVLGAVLGFVLICLAALAGYIRTDEATKGYYTNRLRLAAAAGVGAAGVAIYRMLT